jgi:hypothetical protein
MEETDTIDRIIDLTLKLKEAESENESLRKELQDSKGKVPTGPFFTAKRAISLLGAAATILDLAIEYSGNPDVATTTGYPETVAKMIAEAQAALTSVQ